MKHFVMVVAVLVSGCGRPVVGGGHPPVTISIIPELYPGTPKAIRVELAGEQQLTRPVGEVLASIEVVGPRGAIQVNPSNVPAELTYRGTTEESFLLPDDLAEGRYDVTVVLEDWGIPVVPGSAEVTQTGRSYRMVFGFPPAGP